jgi:hypothetical protein
MFRVTIRELLWLTAIAALAIGWLIHTRSEQTENHFLQIQLMEQRLHEASELVTQLKLAAKNQSEGGATEME